MVEMTRRTMILAHGGRVVEQVEIKRELTTPRRQEEEDSQPPIRPSSFTEDCDDEEDEDRSVAVSSYRTVKL